MDTTTQTSLVPLDEEIEAGNSVLQPVSNEHGRIGYIIAWLCGVPASLLFIVFLIRGH